MKSNRIRKLLGGLSFTSALFIFQACYGTPQDLEADALIEGKVKSAQTGLAIKGIRVTIEELNQYTDTDNNGSFQFYTPVADSFKLRFEDKDSTLNGTYTSFDTLLKHVHGSKFLDISLSGR